MIYSPEEECIIVLSKGQTLAVDPLTFNIKFEPSSVNYDTIYIEIVEGTTLLISVLPTGKTYVDDFHSLIYYKGYLES